MEDPVVKYVRDTRHFPYGPLGTRIATNDGKLLFLAEMLGDRHWVDRTGQLYSPLVSWLPVIVLPKKR